MGTLILLGKLWFSLGQLYNDSYALHFRLESDNGAEENTGSAREVIFCSDFELIAATNSADEVTKNLNAFILA